MAASSFFVSLTISGSENDLLPDPEFICKGKKTQPWPENKGERCRYIGHPAEVIKF
jgi:hypothetical protein